MNESNLSSKTVSDDRIEYLIGGDGGPLYMLMSDEIEDTKAALRELLERRASETNEKPIAWRHLVDSPYTKHPEWCYTEHRPTMEPERFEPLYTRPAEKTEGIHT